MKVGMTFYLANPQFPMQLDSLRYVAKSMTDAITARHELVFLPPEYNYASGETLVRMTEDYLRSIDVLVGCPSGMLPEVRQRMGSSVPFVGFLLGVLSRSGWDLEDQVPFLTSNDVFVANCTADLELAGRYFSNAQARLLPFAVDESVFYPVDEAERRAIRERHGFRPVDRILVYSGRTTLQKNVHGLLKVFSAVQALVPEACLVIAGPTQQHGSDEFGVLPVNMPNTVRRLVARLGIPEGRVRMMDRASPKQLRELYNVADAKVNLTLHHDENFGLAQVEAMACGTPVIGTAWGGLKDTVVDGVSGYTVSTSPTPSGVKVSWWEAVNRIVGLLCDPAARERFRESCVRHATGRYSQARYEGTLLDILDTAVAGRHRTAEPLQPTSFARELWTNCHAADDDSAPYLRSPRSLALYQELMAPIAAPTREHVSHCEALEPRHVLTLATPVREYDEGLFRLDDPMYPFDLDVPDTYREAFGAILCVLREEPAITAERLGRALADGIPHAQATVEWMLCRGLLLRTRPVDGWVDPERIGRRMGEPLFRIERLDRMSTDFVMF